jgi:hypothetical protein
MFKVHESRRYFLKDRKPHFFVIDTAWMCLSNLTVEEFEEYAVFRAEQGFNAILIMNTPIFSDMSDNVRCFPYEVREDGSFNLTNINSAYFDQAEAKLRILNNLGITPIITVISGAYIKGSNLAEYFDCSGKQFESLEDFKLFADYTMMRYRKYNPIWMIGGDAALNDTNYVQYKYIAEQIRKESPEDLITAHIAGGTFVDERFVDEGLVDFYTYQSGHVLNNKDDLMSPATMAEAYYNMDKKLPIINLEPMYEAHGFGNRFGRFDNFYLRRAFWYSVLSGANAGFTYGAHGVWMFFNHKATFNNERWSKIPMNWRSALSLPGSYDIPYCSNLFDKFNMFNIIPREDLNLTPYDEIKIAASEDMSLVAAYTPFTNEINLPLDLNEYECKWYLLDEYKKVIKPEIRMASGEQLCNEQKRISKGQKNTNDLPDKIKEAKLVSTVSMYQYNCDAVLICVRKLK